MWRPQGVKISELPAGVPAASDVLPFADLAAGQTEKTTFADAIVVVDQLGLTLAVDAGMMRFT